MPAIQLKRSARHSAGKTSRPAVVIDISRRVELVDLAGVRAIASDLEALPNPRDVAAAIRETVKDFRSLTRRVHGTQISRSELEGAATVMRSVLKAEINRRRTGRRST